MSVCTYIKTKTVRKQPAQLHVVRKHSGESVLDPHLLLHFQVGLHGAAAPPGASVLQQGDRKGKRGRRKQKLKMTLRSKVSWVQDLRQAPGTQTSSTLTHTQSTVVGSSANEEHNDEQKWRFQKKRSGKIIRTHTDRKTTAQKKKNKQMKAIKSARGGVSMQAGKLLQPVCVCWEYRVKVCSLAAHRDNHSQDSSIFTCAWIFSAFHRLNFHIWLFFMISDRNGGGGVRGKDRHL